MLRNALYFSNEALSVVNGHHSGGVGPVARVVEIEPPWHVHRLERYI